MKPRDAETSLEREFDQHFDLPTIRSVTPGRPFAWLALGVRDMRANLVESLVYGTVIAIAGWLIWAYTKDRPQLFTTSVTSFFLIAPLLAAGLYEISRRQERNIHTSFENRCRLARQRRRACSFRTCACAVGDLLGTYISHSVCAVLSRSGTRHAELLS